MRLDSREFELLVFALTKYADLEQSDGNYIMARTLRRMRDEVERTNVIRGVA